MSNNSENRRRALAEVVSLDAWHDEFSEEVSRVDLHVDVVFETGRVGGEPDSPVRFRLSIKQSDIVVIVPESEPVIVDKGSVSRDSPQFQTQVVESFERAASASVKTAVTGSLSSTSLGASLTAEGGGEVNIASNKRLEMTATLQVMIVTQAMTPDGNYRWSPRPSNGPVLQGRPWDAQRMPRMKIIDQRKDRTKGIPPAVRVEVRCRREDIVISEIIIKDETIWESVKRRAGFRNRMAAAEAYIRDRLVKEGLTIRNFGDAFGELTLASILAGPQGT